MSIYVYFIILYIILIFTSYTSYYIIKCIKIYINFKVSVYFYKVTTMCNFF